MAIPMPAPQKNALHAQPKLQRNFVQAFLQLIRLPNLFTAAADPLAGALAAAGLLGLPLHWPAALAAAAVGVFLYAGGVVLNDYVDLKEDSQDRPDRPLPSGEVSPAEALAVSVCLFGIGAGLALIALPSGAKWTVLALILSILLYNIWAKHVPVAGPIVMGACRALNIYVGLWTVTGGFEALWWVGLLSLGHFAAFTYLGEAEASTPSPSQIAAVFLAAAAVSGVLVWQLGTAWMTLLAVGVYFLINVESAIRLIRERVVANVHRGVKRGILSHVLIHVAVVGALAGIGYGLIPLLLLGASTVAARTLVMT